MCKVKYSSEGFYVFCYFFPKHQIFLSSIYLSIHLTPGLMALCMPYTGWWKHISCGMSYQWRHVASWKIYNNLDIYTADCSMQRILLTQDMLGLWCILVWRNNVILILSVTYQQGDNLLTMIAGFFREFHAFCKVFLTEMKCVYWPGFWHLASIVLNGYRLLLRNMKVV